MNELKTFAFGVGVIVFVCFILAQVHTTIVTTSNAAPEDQQIRLSRLEAKVTLLAEQVKQLSIACAGDKDIKEYRWESGVGKFVCQNCRVE